MKLPNGLSGFRAESEAAGRPFERSLIDSALAALDLLIDSQGEQGLEANEITPPAFKETCGK
jgi:hypothetical protein